MNNPLLPVRVLHIGKFYPPFVGGMENFIGDLLPALENCGIATAAIVHGHEFGRKRGYMKDEGNRIYRVPSYGNFSYAPISPTFPIYLLRLITKFSPHILHMHLPNISAFWAILFPHVRKIPWILQWQSDVIFSEINFRLGAVYGPFEQHVLRKARQIIVATPPYLSSSTALSKWRGKCRIIPLGLDEKRFEKPGADSLAWAETIWRPEKMRVLAIGRLTYYKGHKILIQASIDLPQTHTLIIGKGDLKNRLSTMVKNSGLTERVELIGFVPDEKLTALLSTCDVLCLPSIERTEAFGLVLLEAMLFSKPVVVSNVPGSGMGWIVCHEKTGLHVTPGDAQDLSKALQFLCDNPERRKTLGNAGKKRFTELFNIEQTAERIASLYQEVVYSTPQK
jgi:glycosyltransferase involved in cell wall biosynthesis